ncbi:hypothetical protein BKA63DRAFT_510259 [Paraphoma chrysanthemicola]|nr:hypothetical protein BKA63DRAFT_510259 [Paraphoma chrysanthemicola]
MVVFLISKMQLAEGGSRMQRTTLCFVISGLLLQGTGRPTCLRHPDQTAAVSSVMAGSRGAGDYDFVFAWEGPKAQHHRGSWTDINGLSIATATPRVGVSA